MRSRLFGWLIAILVPGVGAFALPAQAAYERATAEERREKQKAITTSDSEDRGTDSEPSSPPTPPLLLAARHWTVEKVSRLCETPDVELRVALVQPDARHATSSWLLARLDRSAAYLPRIQTAEAIRVHLIGAHAPPLA